MQDLIVVPVNSEWWTIRVIAMNTLQADNSFKMYITLVEKKYFKM